MKNYSNNEISVIDSVSDNGFDTSKLGVDIDPRSSIMVTELELENGESTSIVTIFRSGKVNFEDLNIGIGTTISRINMYGDPRKAVKSKKTNIYTNESGTFEKAVGFPKQSFN